MINSDTRDFRIGIFFVEENHSLSEWIKGLSYGQIKTPVI